MKKKILFVIPYLVDGGAERAVSNITRSIPLEWDVDILVNCDKVINYPCRGEIISLNIDKEAKTDSVWFQLGVFIRRVAMLHKLKRENSYIACISFLDSANVANILSGNRYCKTIVSVRNSLVGRAKVKRSKYLTNPMVKITHNYADMIVAVSQGIANELISQFGICENKVKVIENGYDLDELGRMARNNVSRDIQKFSEGKFLIVTSGRMNYQKGQWHLIRAFSDVLKKIPNARLVIIGDGSLNPYLHELVVDYQLEDKVLMPGFLCNPYSIVARADVFVMPSLFEGFPNALAEAMCLGIPCIATDFMTGARELLSPSELNSHERVMRMSCAEYGIITPICSGIRKKTEALEEAEIEFAKAIIYLFEHSEVKKHYREMSLKRGKELDISTIVEKWLDVVRN